MVESRVATGAEESFVPNVRLFEVALPCSDPQVMEHFFVRMFDAHVLERGPAHCALSVGGIVLRLRRAADFRAPPGPGAERGFLNHLGWRVDDLEAAIADLTARGAHFVVTPALVRQWRAAAGEAGGFVDTHFIAPPLTRARIDAGEFTHEVALLAGPDNLWIELNEVHEPPDVNWFAEATASA